MKRFPKSMAPTIAKTKNIKKIAVLYAGVLVVFAVSQLYSFEAFNSLFESFWLPGGIQTPHLLAATIVISEVFALPFLLRMRVSLAMRVVSMVLGWLVVILWSMVSLWLLFTVNAVHNIGFFGDVITVQPGWWVIVGMVVFGILSAWISWGMWPTPRRT